MAHYPNNQKRGGFVPAQKPAQEAPAVEPAPKAEPKPADPPKPVYVAVGRVCYSSRTTGLTTAEHGATVDPVDADVAVLLAAGAIRDVSASAVADDPAGDAVLDDL